MSEEIDQTHLLIATVVACAVLAMKDDDVFIAKFEDQLKKAQMRLRHMGQAKAEYLDVREAIGWTRRLIRVLA
ncbi:MAG: hypothetical protein ACJ8AI_03765 [Rhodopila sp.]